MENSPEIVGNMAALVIAAVSFFVGGLGGFLLAAILTSGKHSEDVQDAYLMGYRQRQQEDSSITDIRFKY